jgi:hypothetical protein
MPLLRQRRLGAVNASSLPTLGALHSQQPPSKDAPHLLQRLATHPGLPSMGGGRKKEREGGSLPLGFKLLPLLILRARAQASPLLHDPIWGCGAQPLKPAACSPFNSAGGALTLA